MIECEWRCAKGWGTAATKRIHETATGSEFNVCDSCADAIEDYTLLEEYK